VWRWGKILEKMEEIAGMLNILFDCEIKAERVKK
jgi:hypothetical protein